MIAGILDEADRENKIVMLRMGGSPELVRGTAIQKRINNAT